MNSPNLIAVSGQAGSGKDQIATDLFVLLNCLESKNWWAVKRFAGKLKKMVAISLNNIPTDLLDEQDYKVIHLSSMNMTVRQYLQRFGTLMRDNFGADFWVNQLFMDYDKSSRWIIPDLRYKNEFEAIKQRGGVCIRVDRPGLPEDPHQSEQEWRGFEFDWVIDNSGSLDDLRKKVQLFIQHFFPGNS